MTQPRGSRQHAGPTRFDRNLVVIGAGSAGLVSAYAAAALGSRVTLVERHRMGGDCLNTGCVPSKTLIRSARVMAGIRRAADLGLAGATAEVDFAAVMDRVREVIRRIEPHDSVERYQRLGVEVIRGEAKLLSPREVSIRSDDGRETRLSTRAVIIATGASPVIPDLEGIAGVDCLTTDTVWDLQALPRRLLVLGGGPVGCELAQAFARLGSAVTLVEKAPQLLPGEDRDVTELLHARFAGEGIDVLTGHEAVRFQVRGDDSVLVTRHRDGETSIAFDRVLLALGRRPRVSGLGLEALGIAVDGPITADGFMQTGVPGVYVAGDVTGPFQFTHAAAHQGWHAAVNALFRPLWRMRVDYTLVPRATFVEPEIARVGLNENGAAARGVHHEVTRLDLAELDRAITDGCTEGFVKVLTPPGRDRILGAVIVGEHAADLLATFVLAMRHGIGLKGILGTIHAYPTLAESARSVAGAWRRRHVPGWLPGWLRRFHDWRRG